jgi:hypothetical protein
MPHLDSETSLREREKWLVSIPRRCTNADERTLKNLLAYPSCQGKVCGKRSKLRSYHAMGFGRVTRAFMSWSYLSAVRMTNLNARLSPAWKMVRSALGNSSLKTKVCCPFSFGIVKHAVVTTSEGAAKEAKRRMASIECKGFASKRCVLFPWESGGLRTG